VKAGRIYIFLLDDFQQCVFLVSWFFLRQEHELSKEEVAGIIEAMVGPALFENFKKNQEIDFAYTYALDARLRGNAYVHRGNYSVALRLIPKVKTLQELNLPPILETFARKKQGFFLVVGTSRSRKIDHDGRNDRSHKYRTH
jgi:Tfp pilus assembly pilus retraction ATPase PilT